MGSGAEKPWRLGGFLRGEARGFAFGLSFPLALLNAGRALLGRHQHVPVEEGEGEEGDDEEPKRDGGALQPAGEHGRARWRPAHKSLVSQRSVALKAPGYGEGGFFGRG